MTMRVWWLAEAALAALVASAALPSKAQTAEAATPARASKPDAEPKDYGPLIDQGLAEYEARDFLEARSLFLKAHALYPNARTLRGLGMAEFELRHYPECIEYLQQSLASTVRPLDDELRGDVQGLLARAEGFVARVRVDVQPESARPQLLLDGVLLQLTPGATLTLQVGEHVIEARAEKYRSEKRKLSVKGGEQQSLRITLSRELFPPTAATEQPRPLYKSPWLWAGAGVVAAGVGVALALLLQPAAKTQVGDPITTKQTPGGFKIEARGGF